MMKDKFIKTSSLKWKEIEKDVFEKECLAGKKGLKISILKIKPGKYIARHRHADTRYNFILKGSMSDGNNEYAEGDLIVNEKGSRHFLEAGSHGCEFLLIWG